MKMHKFSKPTLELYLGKGLSLYDTLRTINYELTSIKFVLDHKELFEEYESYLDYKKYAKVRRATLRGMVILINKDKKKRDDNRIENLELYTKKEHGKFHNPTKKINCIKCSKSITHSVNSMCRKCNNIEYKKQNKEKISEYNKKYREKKKNY